MGLTEIELLEKIYFLAEVTALASSWIAGTQSLKFLIYIKNHKTIW